MVTRYLHNRLQVMPTYARVLFLIPARGGGVWLFIFLGGVTQSKHCLRCYPKCACARNYPKHVIARALARGNLSLPQGVILNFSEESPTRLYAVNVLSLVGFEEILEFLFVAPPRLSLQAISALGLIATLDYAQCANQAD